MTAANVIASGDLDGLIHFNDLLDLAFPAILQPTLERPDGWATCSNRRDPAGAT
jgi:hypothetical protein